MIASHSPLRYAEALYEIAAEKERWTPWEKELGFVEETLAAYGELATLLYHPQVPLAAKKDTIVKVFGPQLSDYVLKFSALARRQAA
jgi:F-type H+-transporting ATPase subunit delta